jgi:hypothetical protein
MEPGFPKNVEYPEHQYVCYHSEKTVLELVSRIKKSPFLNLICCFREF